MAERENVCGLHVEDLIPFMGRVMVLKPSARHNSLWQEVIAKYLFEIPSDLVFVIAGQIDKEEDSCDGDCRSANLEGTNVMFIITLYEIDEERINGVMGTLRGLFTFEREDMLRWYFEYLFLHEYAHYCYSMFQPENPEDEKGERLADMHSYDILDKTLSKDNMLKLFLFIKSVEFSYEEEDLERYRNFRQRKAIEVPVNGSGNSGPSAISASTNGQTT